jgi:hypothetical protein
MGIIYQDEEFMAKTDSTGANIRMFRKIPDGCWAPLGTLPNTEEGHEILREYIARVGEVWPYENNE